MRVDVSEIKTFKGCKRQWKLSSRNGFHLRPIVIPSHFALGTIFHESLHQLYLGVPYEKVMEFVRREISTDQEAALLAMVPGYYKNVLEGDLDRYKVLDIEHHFHFVPCDLETGEVLVPDLEVCGSIDMIVLDETENAIYGFEHKTCKNFRDSSFIWMDEQPRVYTIALMEYIREYNEKQMKQWRRQYVFSQTHENAKCPEKPEPATLGGIYINEVKKLLRDFRYRRTLCKYPGDDLANFARSFFGTCKQCKHAVDTNDPAYPAPSYFACQMCDFKTVCETYMYSTLDKDTVINEFQEEFKIREVDHLDEKAERTGPEGGKANE